MAILFSNEINRAVNEELNSAKESVQIVTAYCKKKTMEALENQINHSVKEKKLLVRFRLDDLIKGSTDFEILQYCRNKDWSVYIRFDLHAKTYIVDKKRGIVGSANATDNGLSAGSLGNIEMGTLVYIENSDIEKINKLFRDAILIDDRIYDLLEQQYTKTGGGFRTENVSWSDEITDLFKPHVENLFSYELPDKDVYELGEYIDFLDMLYVDDIKKLRDVFQLSNAYKWLLAVLEEAGGCVYFGELSSKLHSALVSEPKPYRKDVKVLLANLLSLIQMLDMEEVEIDRPNYSQRIRLK